MVDRETGSSAPSQRRAALARLSGEAFDVLIVGGGVVGAGALLDAQSRGLRAALVEQSDIAAGTSSRSSRLIHGGLRYLEQLHFGLVAEALEERARLLRNAPHLVRLEPFLFPIYGWPLIHQGFYGSGILLYDLLGSRQGAGFAQHMRRAAALEFAPQLRPEGLQAGIVYHDGVEDDARFALAVARSAVALGAVLATRVRADAPLLEGGQAIGVRAHDRDTGEGFDIRATRVIDATGVWAAHPDERFAPVAGAAKVVPSRGAHLVIRRERLEARGGMTLRIPGRVVFIIPWPNHWLIGTTDHEDDRALDHPSALDEDVDELLGVVNRRMTIDLTRDDILGTYAGLRPLVGDVGGSTIKASREHRVTTDPSGVVRIGGGKYTTYRVMARDAVDSALGPETTRARPSRTADLSLVGAAPLADLSILGARLERETGLPAAVARRLVDRHGIDAEAVVDLGRDRDLLRPLGSTEHIEAEVPWAVTREYALTLDDTLSRRMRLSQELPDRAASIAPRVAELMGSELGWDRARQASEVSTFLRNARAEFDVPGR
ncbi:MAG: glycerol-3-phosphate dehydrogenase/oxidase [Chloroflexi bacterium]|nr:glycerol-3-phosphate dehydrogenase/oxidase [Chloroflexota bacterium]